MSDDQTFVQEMAVRRSHLGALSTALVTLTSAERDRLCALAARAPSEKTCATCQFYDQADDLPTGVCRLGVVPPCQSLVQYPRAEHFGCNLWKQADE